MLRLTTQKATKIAPFYTVIQKLVNIPMFEKDYNKELNIIKQIRVNNHFKVEIVDDILKKKTFKQIWIYVRASWAAAP